MNTLRQIHTINAYSDLLGKPVSVPVMQVGSGTPHVVLVALQHGWELIGLDTALQVMRAADIEGTLTLITVASPLAYQDRTRLSGQYLCPSSGQQVNMNRVHPGSATGTVVERMAVAIDAFVQSLQPDLVIDLHAYASQSMPHGIVDPCAPALQRRLERLLTTSQIPWYREFDTETLQAQVLDKALSAVWVRRGVPAITVELGPLDLFSPEQSHQAQMALTNVLVAFGTVRGDVVPVCPKNLSGNIWRRAEVVYEGDGSGYLRPTVAIGANVRRGEQLGEVIVPSGKVVGVVRAPHDGVHFVWHNEYRVFPGSVVGVQLVRA